MQRKYSVGAGLTSVLAGVALGNPVTDYMTVSLTFSAAFALLIGMLWKNFIYSLKEGYWDELANMASALLVCCVGLAIFTILGISAANNAGANTVTVEAALLLTVVGGITTGCAAIPK